MISSMRRALAAISSARTPISTMPKEMAGIENVHRCAAPALLVVLPLCDGCRIIGAEYAGRHGDNQNMVVILAVEPVFFEEGGRVRLRGLGCVAAFSDPGKTPRRDAVIGKGARLG